MRLERGRSVQRRSCPVVLGLGVDGVFAGCYIDPCAGNAYPIIDSLGSVWLDGVGGRCTAPDCWVSRLGYVF